MINSKSISGGYRDSGTATLIVSNKEVKGFMKIVKSFKDSGLLSKGVTQTTENKTK